MTETPASLVNPPSGQLELLTAELEGRLKAQSGEVESLDRKASTGLAATGVVLGLVVNNVDKFATALSGPRNVFLGSLALLAAALACGVWSIWPRRAKVVPSPRRLIEGYYAKSRDDTLANLVSARLRAFEENKNLSLSKILWLRLEMSLLALGGASASFSPSRERSCLSERRNRRTGRAAPPGTGTRDADVATAGY